jgi:hypothetical protein
MKKDYIIIWNDNESEHYYDTSHYHNGGFYRWSGTAEELKAIKKLIKKKKAYEWEIMTLEEWYNQHDLFTKELSDEIDQDIIECFIGEDEEDDD